ncbi:hypothetical protein GCM10023086_71680 [Streptomyces venetus]|uniref:Uncharacterized protein n=1 Tax=Streptomyces venetus TaxID=1701086 RepID=A0ABP8HDQ0_9ACTN
MLRSQAPGGRAWLLTWDQAHDTLAFYRRAAGGSPSRCRARRRTSWCSSILTVSVEPDVFVDPDRTRDGSGSGAAVSGQ